MGKGKASWQQLDAQGCQNFNKVQQKPPVVVEKLKSWEPVQKGHCSVELSSTGPAVIVCSGCKGELSPANYGGTWSQHSKSCQNLAEFLDKKQATPKSER
jgi:hypothetical protein